MSLKSLHWVSLLSKLSLGLVLFFLLSCSAINNTSVSLTKGLNYNLEHPASYGARLQVNQKIKTQTPKFEKEILAQLSIDEKQLSIVALSPMGIVLFKLNWDGDQLTTQVPPYIQLPFEPSFLVADIQLALWPKFANNPDLNYRESNNERVIFHQGKKIMLIRYEKSIKDYERIHIQHFEKKYHVWIQNIKE